MKLLTCLVFVFTTIHFSHSKTISSHQLHSQEMSDYTQIILDSLWSEAGHSSSQLPKGKVEDKIIKKDSQKEKIEEKINEKNEEQPSKLKISKIKDLKNNSANKIPSNDQQKNILDKNRKKNDVPTPSLSKGQKLIQAKLEENRQRLKVSETKNPYEDKKEKSLLDLRNEGLNQLKTRTQNTYKNWQAEVQKTYQRWSKARELFLGRVDEYKEATFEFLEAEHPGFSQKEIKKPTTQANKTDYYLIPGAFDVPIKDQGKRPTCAAFTGTRAIEILLNNQMPKVDLSEQFFYWASKPQCQTTPCSQRGSWITNAYDLSKKSRSYTFPMEKDCPYQGHSKVGNETQIPLTSSCHRGMVNVDKYRQLYNLDQVISALKKNSPIISGFKLSPNFYKSKGLVKYSESFQSGSMDNHAAGHALIIVGLMKLPESLHSTEGKLCFLVSNSWGEGWGRGGHGCLTENWVRAYKVDNPFIALDRIRYEE